MPTNEPSTCLSSQHITIIDTDSKQHGCKTFHKRLITQKVWSLEIIMPLQGILGPCDSNVVVVWNSQYAGYHFTKGLRQNLKLTHTSKAWIYIVR